MAEVEDLIRNFRSGEGGTRLRVMLLCVLAATTFWFLNALNKEHTSTINYPLEFLYDRENYVAVEELPEDVQINVNSVGWNLLKNSLGIKVEPLQIAVENPVDIRGIAGNSLPGLISEQLSDFQLNYVLTDTLRIHLDQRIRKTIHLQVDTARIALAPNVGIRSSVQITPDSVVLEGAANELEALGDTLKIILGEDPVESDFNEIVGIDLPRAVNAVNNNSVRIQFDIVEFENRSVQVPVNLINSPFDSARLEPEQIEIRYRIAADEESVNPAAFRVVADYNEMNRSDSLVRPVLAVFP
ncbi:MAG: hypothetical protein P8X57_00295, partial [Cyclobacteriaceae bacterium]